MVQGSSHADESMLTGEASPVLKKAGDAVIGGTVNQGSQLLVSSSASFCSVWECMGAC